LASCELDACFGAPEPHGFTVRNRKALVSRPIASTASRLTFVTIAIRPLCPRRDARRKAHISEKRKRYFGAERVDGSIELKGLRKLIIKYRRCDGL